MDHPGISSVVISGQSFTSEGENRVKTAFRRRGGVGAGEGVPKTLTPWIPIPRVRTRTAHPPVADGVPGRRAAPDPRELLRACGWWPRDR